MKKIFYIQILILLWNISLQAQNYTYPYLDPNVDIDLRVDDLILKLSLQEKANMMLYDSPEVARLGIPSYNWWNECLHGVARAGNATVFPQAIALAATFDDQLVFRIADAISDEARAKYHTAVRQGNRAQYLGLSFWTPNINIFRDPRWGRGQETYGEDPFLTASIGTAFVMGLQGNDPHYLKASACVKHYVVHSGPEASRHYFDAVPDEIDFRETYLPAFKRLVDAEVEAVMCAYNRTYGVPCCGSPYLLGDILREEWGFEGHVVSDCWALDDIWKRHKVMETQVQAAAMAAKAGVNLNCGYIYTFLPEAVRLRMITEDEVDALLRPLLRTRFRLGMFDPDSLNPYACISPDVINSEEHKLLAREAASKSLVLLKNNGILPLNKDSIKNIFVTGPMAADLSVLVGNYNGYSGDMVTFLEGIVGYADPDVIVNYTSGVLLNNDSLFYGQWQAGKADAVIAVIGISHLMEGENGDAMLNQNGGDRTSIEMPENQVEYIRKLREQTQGNKLIVVVTGGSAIAMPEIEEMADALLFAWYPGEQGGNALADVIFGEVNPAGRLPVTFYKSTSDLPPFDDYSMQGRTYRFFTGLVQFPFGYGMSYSKFEYQGANLLMHKNELLEELSVRVKIKNSSLLDGEEVIQIYSRYLEPGTRNPIKTLVGFKRVFIPAGESIHINIPLDIEFMKRWDKENQQYVFLPGDYEFLIGASSEDIRLELSADFQ
jgi:beta-glucosidase